jgi:hypothetical protein
MCREAVSVLDADLGCFISLSTCSSALRCQGLEYMSKEACGTSKYMGVTGSILVLRWGTRAGSQDIEAQVAVPMGRLTEQGQGSLSEVQDQGCLWLSPRRKKRSLLRGKSTLS